MSRVISFLCRCFGEIGDSIDLDAMQRKLAEDHAVVAAEVCDTVCLKEDLSRITATVEKSGAEKVLLVACSWLARGETIVRALADQGIHPATMELVDLREGCSWVHGEDRSGANAKAWNLISMGLASLLHKRSSEEVRVSVRPEALVIGAGPAGLAAAASLAELGFPVHLVERTSKPGGMLNLTSNLFPFGDRPWERLGALLDVVQTNSLVKFYGRATVTSIDGAAGDFTVTLSTPQGEQWLTSGVVIVACGAKPVLPHGVYGYGELKNVISQLELERQLSRGSVQAERVVFIQCVAARCDERPYCSAICCPMSLKNAMRILASAPGAEITVLHHDIMTRGIHLEDYYRRARAAGVQFVRFDPESPPEVKGDDVVGAILIRDVLSGRSRLLAADLVVLSTPLSPHEENDRLAEMLGLRLDRHGFFSGIEPMHPLETPSKGIFLCGSARTPVSAEQAISQGQAAGIKASAFLSQREIVASALSDLPAWRNGFAAVDADNCSGCGNCVTACPFGACQLQKDGKVSASRVNQVNCKGCGTCVGVCPNGAIQIPEQNSHALREMLRRAF